VVFSITYHGYFLEITMQTHITDKDMFISINNLDLKRLFSNIYENIHGLASLFNINDQLINPVKNISNKPQCKLWKGYENNLLGHIVLCYNRWWYEVGHKKYMYSETINARNIMILLKYATPIFKYPEWVTNETIKVHRSVLIQKELQKDDKLNNEMFSKCYGKENNDNIIKKYQDKLKQNYHYRKLWSNCPANLKMRYDW
jgi:hypothetical protein